MLIISEILFIAIYFPRLLEANLITGNTLEENNKKWATKF